MITNTHKFGKRERLCDGAEYEFWSNVQPVYFFEDGSQRNQINDKHEQYYYNRDQHVISDIQNI